MPFKTLNVPSFFAGVATVLAILAVGFGGGVMMGGVISGDSKAPTKIERQTARDAKETKSADMPVIPAAPVVVAPAPTAPAPAQAAVAAPDPVQTAAAPTPQAEPQPQPAPQQQAQPALQPQTQSPPVARSQMATQSTPSPGPEKPVSLAQPPQEQQFVPSQLSRREQARYWRHQRREERRKQFTERRLQVQTGREETRSAIERARPPEADEERDDDGPAVTAPRGRAGALPPLPFLRLFGGD
jgi:hypothetical protein